jgi:hypothetical protein
MILWHPYAQIIGKSKSFIQTVYLSGQSYLPLVCKTDIESINRRSRWRVCVEI